MGQSRAANAELHHGTIVLHVFERVVSWFGAHGAVVERVITENGAAQKVKTRPYRPQSGKI